MPYIAQQVRTRLHMPIDNILACLLELDEQDRDGAINYIITKILIYSFKDKYIKYERAIGLLESVKLEFYRRAVTEYENRKIKDNGDVY